MLGSFGRHEKKHKRPQGNVNGRPSNIRLSCILFHDMLLLHTIMYLEHVYIQPLRSHFSHTLKSYRTHTQTHSHATLTRQHCDCEENCIYILCVYVCGVWIVQQFCCWISVEHAERACLFRTNRETGAVSSARTVNNGRLEYGFSSALSSATLSSSDQTHSNRSIFN